MLDAKQAVANAMQSIQELYMPEKLEGLMLEEVQLSDDGHFWLITVGFTQATAGNNPIATTAGNPKPRVYKVVKIDADKGKMIAMNIRKL
jgi:hypothetical protein